MSEEATHTDDQPDPRDGPIVDRVFEILGHEPLTQTEPIDRLGDTEIWELAEDLGVGPLEILEDITWRFDGFLDAPR